MPSGRKKALPRSRLLKGVDFLILDADGVLTDGRVGFTDGGDTVSFFSIQDGMAVYLGQALGLKFALVSGRESPALRERAKLLGISPVCTGVRDKAQLVAQLIKAKGLAKRQALYMGDDLNDIPPMREVGVAVAVKNAVPEVRQAAHFTTDHCGGAGAIREVVEAVLKAKGLWKQALRMA